jgi:hypothetical protein
MLKIKWKREYIIGNEEAYTRAEEEWSRWNTREEIGTRLFGHTQRHNEFLKNIIEGKVD